jgi:methionyl-tRNA synthetase
LDKFNFDEGVRLLNSWVAAMDTEISNYEPWKKFKEGVDISSFMYQMAEWLRHVGIALLPIIPESAEKILHSLGIKLEDLEPLEVEQQWGRLKPGTKVQKGEALFPRFEK